MVDWNNPKTRKMAKVLIAIVRRCELEKLGWKVDKDDPAVAEKPPFKVDLMSETLWYRGVKQKSIRLLFDRLKVRRKDKVFS